MTNPNRLNSFLVRKGNKGSLKEVRCTLHSDRRAFLDVIHLPLWVSLTDSPLCSLFQEELHHWAPCPLAELCQRGAVTGNQEGGSKRRSDTHFLRFPPLRSPWTGCDPQQKAIISRQAVLQDSPFSWCCWLQITEWFLGLDYIGPTSL